MTFAPDGRRLATAEQDGSAQLWNVAGPRDHPHSYAVLNGHDDRVHSIAFTADGQTLLTSSEDRTAHWPPSGCPPRPPVHQIERPLAGGALGARPSRPWSS
ncbi:WD40 repeat domain-containing protein [Streptomyces sp. NPDC048384]|uniref:WD40 repeat domain-containing protein n=1 Tax=unclassified Streptomyces TaxID=2593676 RepID=UPI0034305A3C